MANKENYTTTVHWLLLWRLKCSLELYVVRLDNDRVLTKTITFNVVDVPNAYENYGFSADLELDPWAFALTRSEEQAEMLLSLVARASNMLLVPSMYALKLKDQSSLNLTMVQDFYDTLSQMNAETCE